MGLEQITTARLILRPFKDADVETAFSWMSDAEVMRFMPFGADTSLEQTRTRIDKYRAHQHQLGFGKWMILERSSGVPVGDSGLMTLPELGWTDLGYRLARAHWGKGYATEAATAWIRAAAGDFGVTELGAFAHVDNLASLRVLAKVGFQQVRRDTVIGIPAVVFRLAL